ncbi:MAG: hypothetical protein U5K38_03310 [Woeseiaceae bacterium]|nr:hypothetical protein [Woeseiaceae bacterium]
MADRPGDTDPGIDLTHAHSSMPATFMWARGFDNRPITITFSPPDNAWRVATQLRATDDPYVFTVLDLQYFMDSPTELSDFQIRSWEVGTGDATQTIRLVVHHDGIDEDVDTYLAMAKKLLRRKPRCSVNCPISITGFTRSLRITCPMSRAMAWNTGIRRSWRVP